MTSASYYFGFEERVDRASYLRTGLLLMVVKYAVDAAVVYSAKAVVWTPLDYLVPLVSISDTKIQLIGSGLATFLIVWTLPFLWIAVSMTMRRAIDAGLSPWTAMWVFVPVLNYVAMLTLACLPTGNSVAWNKTLTGSAKFVAWRSAMSGTTAGVGFAVLALLVFGFWKNAYGLAVFLAVPFVMGVLVAFLYNRPERQPLVATLRIVVVSLVATGGAILLFALEGLICLVMAFPISIVLASLGAAAGRAAARGSRLTPSAAAFSILLVPGTFFLEPVPEQRVYEVVSAIEVQASADAVWNHVVEFNPITAPPALLFRLGVAYPVRASITGTGVGALRRCEFSTGAFIEPITVWEKPRRLSFDVVSQPPPMRELSPYGAITPSHLNGFFKAVRGEFRLVSLSAGSTRLEGSTWYTLDIHPHAYWRPLAERIVSSIHGRVLAHIALEAERSSTSQAVEPNLR